MLEEGEGLVWEGLVWEGLVWEGLVWEGFLSFVLFASSVRHVESRRLIMGIQFSCFIGSFAD